jgi:hypothetical protein
MPLSWSSHGLPRPRHAQVVRAQRSRTVSGSFATLGTSSDTCLPKLETRFLFVCQDTYEPPWSLLTNHAQVLICIARDPGIRLREIGETVGITERAAHRLVGELATAATSHASARAAGPATRPIRIASPSVDGITPFTWYRLAQARASHRTTATAEHTTRRSAAEPSSRARIARRAGVSADAHHTLARDDEQARLLLLGEAALSNDRVEFVPTARWDDKQQYGRRGLGSNRCIAPYRPSARRSNRRRAYGATALHGKHQPSPGG